MPPSQGTLKIGRPAAASDCRCECGSLLARIVADGVEIRCRRCKRELLVPWSARGGWVQASALPSRSLHRARGSRNP